MVSIVSYPAKWIKRLKDEAGVQWCRVQIQQIRLGYYLIFDVGMLNVGPMLFCAIIGWLSKSHIGPDHFQLESPNLVHFCYATTDKIIPDKYCSPMFYQNTFINLVRNGQGLATQVGNDPGRCAILILNQWPILYRQQHWTSIKFLPGKTSSTIRALCQHSSDTNRHPAVAGGKLETTESTVGPLGGCPKPQQFVKSVSTQVTTPRIGLRVGNCSFKALVDSGAGKSLISSRLFERLQQQMEEFKHTREVAVNLFDQQARLACQGTVTVDVLVEDERPREPFQQEFIVIPEIMEECILGLDALYEHKFMIDGRERRVYRVRESDQLQNDDKPTMMVAVKTKIPPSSACVVESENSDVKLSLDTACFLVKKPTVTRRSSTGPLRLYKT
ncbi:hypothetical protein OUZ56_025502 [Daphnia magna]|uniref:Peptidase A2 domain-containing protein n=1 Tax=Daphnia magna TaxID=35525 RepID=A0ABQ9ZKM8_9CRUS|nr:hypothetical protein OUZ56_025502 [Daphnia magna]